jgi:ComF family protein
VKEVAVASLAGLGSLASLRSLANGLISVVLSPECVVCKTTLDDGLGGPVCQDCWRGIGVLSPPLCRQCGEPLPSWRRISVAEIRCPRCRRRESPISRARAIGPHDGSLKGIVQALKYHHCESLAAGLGARMRLAGGDLLAACDVVVPVPLHARRQRARGFNQAELLARALGPPVLLALKRRRGTPSQTGLPAARRHANVRHAFAMRRRLGVEGLRVLLVDDVCTTGATVEACARVLRQAGAVDVSVLTAARAVARRPE